MTLYVDGLKADSDTYNADVLVITRLVGSYAGISTSQFLNGTLDDFKVFNRTLSSTEIIQNYNNYNLLNGELMVGLNLSIDLNKTLYYTLVNSSNNLNVYSTLTDANTNIQTVAGLSCLLTYNNTGNANAQTCYNNFLNTAIAKNLNTNGMMMEHNSVISSAGGGSKGGYSTNYQDITLWSLGRVNLYLNWQNITNILNNASELTYYQFQPYLNDFVVQAGYSTRQDFPNNIVYRYNSTNGLDGSKEQHILWAFYLNNTWANQFQNETAKRLTPYYPYNGRGIETWWLIELYNNWKSSSEQLTPVYNGARYLKTFSSLVNIKTNPNFYISYGNTTPTGGVIADIFVNSTNLHLTSGSGISSTPLGLGILTSNNFSNGWDVNSRYTALSSTYPYKINFFGNITNISQSVSSTTYNITYTFYDNYLEVNQSTNSNVELQLWSASTETIGTGQIRGIELINGNIFNNATFIPLNFVFNYNDSSASGSYGIVDKFNATGSNFHYIIQMSESGGFYTRTNDYILLNNLESGTPSTKTIPIYDSTNALIYFSNNSVACSTISSCNGEFNISLSPNNYTYILDNFNLSESSPRQFSPLWFSSSSSTSKHIASNLSQTISGVTVIISVNNCDSIGSMTFTPDSGNNIQTFNKNQFTCISDNQASLVLNYIEPALNSNILEWSYGCSAFERTGYTIIQIAGVLIILAGSIFFIYKGDLISQMTVGQLVMTFVIITVGIGLFVATVNIIALSCVS